VATFKADMKIDMRALDMLSQRAQIVDENEDAGEVYLSNGTFKATYGVYFPKDSTGKVIDGPGIVKSYSLYDPFGTKWWSISGIGLSEDTLGGISAPEFLNKTLDKNDTLIGSSLDDYFYGGAGSDVIYGGMGNDGVGYKGASDKDFLAQYNATTGVLTMSDLRGNLDEDKLHSIERVEFDDGGLAFDLHGDAGFVARLIGAVIGPNAVQNQYYVRVGLDSLKKGMSVSELADLALNASGIDKLKPMDACKQFYSNLYRSVDESPLVNDFADKLSKKYISLTELALLAANTDTNANNIDLVGLQTHGLAYSTT
jgi:hypothetical protein